MADLQSCVKLNNIEAATQQLDKLYEELGVDELAALDPVDEDAISTTQQYLFSVKIVLAEGLAMKDGSNKLPDAFAIIADTQGNRFAKTRTIYDDVDPRWDETFDISIRSPAWFAVWVHHRTLTGKMLLGRAVFQLDPAEYADLISKDLLLPFDPSHGSGRGHVLLRVSMEGERDDIQYHFARAFRCLKRTEADMVRTFVDKVSPDPVARWASLMIKMTPVLRHTLSRASIKSVIKPASNPLDYNQAMGKLSAAYRTALNNVNNVAKESELSIPRPAGEIPPPPPAKTVKPELTDAQIEAAIHPLFDYLEMNNATLASTLSAEAMQSVMTKLWKQILSTIEAIMLSLIHI